MTQRVAAYMLPLKEMTYRFTLWLDNETADVQRNCGRHWSGVWCCHNRVADHGKAGHGAEDCDDSEGTGLK